MCETYKNIQALESYIIHGQPEAREKALAWQAAIGLQDVDGLQTSPYLLETARKHIDGQISDADAANLVSQYYQNREDRKEAEAGSLEADTVSARINQILSEKTFALSPVELQQIHLRLFSGLLPDAGTFRNYNLSKKEWVLGGESVIYSPWEIIQETLSYDFDREREFSTKNKSDLEIARHIARFVSGIWQIHPFCEGNTRTIAVFAVRYLKKYGFPVNYQTFAKHSWYFRNALVRANYDDVRTGVRANPDYLELFFDNLLFGKNHELNNRELHIECLEPLKST